jgi:hypothetical protein
MLDLRSEHSLAMLALVEPSVTFSVISSGGEIMMQQHRLTPLLQTPSLVIHFQTNNL